MKKINKAALLAAMTTVGAASLLTVTAASTFVDVITAKKLPRVATAFQDRISGSDINTEFASATVRAAKSLLSIESETVSILNRDGIKLTGHFYPAKSPERIIIAMHGWRSGYAIDYGLAYEFMNMMGCSILFPDHRAHGDSEGERIGFGVLERFDCVDWAKYIEKRFGKDIPVYLLGVSMGGATVLMASSLDLPVNVRGIISDCAFTSPDDIWCHVINNNIRVKSKVIYSLMKYMIYKKAHFVHTVSTLDAVSKTKIPILFVHGTEDKFVPIDMTYRNFNVCASPKYLLTVEGADHGMSYFTDSERYRDAVCSFFERYDLM